MRYDLSDVDVPAWHATWWDQWVKPHVLVYAEVTDTVQDAAVRSWALGPAWTGEEPQWVAQEIADGAWESALKWAQQRSTPNKQRAERLVKDETWEWISERPENHVVDPEYGILDQLLLDAPPNQRGFLYYWAVEGFTVAEASQRAGISRATGFRWRDELVTVLREKWSA